MGESATTAKQVSNCVFVIKSPLTVSFCSLFLPHTPTAMQNKRSSLREKTSTPATTPKRPRVSNIKPAVPSPTPPASINRKKRGPAANGAPASGRKRAKTSKKASDVFDFDEEEETSIPITTPLRLLSAKKTSNDCAVGDFNVSNKCRVDSDANSSCSDESDAESVNAPTNGTSSSNEESKKFCASCYDEIEDLSKSIACSGPCLLSYHTECLGDLKVESDSSEWKCAECLSGKHRCFVCSSDTEETTKCSMKDCGRFYHVNCLTKFPHKKSSDSFTCPLHFCLTCYNDHDEDNVYRSVNRRLLQCVKCPTAYHFLDDCLAAGSTEIVSKMYIECPEHLDRKSFKVCNVSYCFACLTGGNIICCEGCPAAFHEKCLEFAVTEGPFYCGSCLKRKQVVYGETVWVKLGNYRWWPARVIAPMNVPDNLMRKKWEKGQFVVQFAGSQDYYWVDKGRVFPYVEGDALKQHNIAVGKSKMDQLYKQALVDIQTFHEEFRKARSISLSKKAKKYAPYKKILTNRPIGSVASFVESEKEDKNEDVTKCSCDAQSEAPCSSDSDCLNRLMNFECNSSNCRAGDKCCNQRFKRRQYVKAKPFNTGSRGWGLKAMQDIKEGTFIVEYVGELIDEKECNRRLDEKAKNNDNNFYFLTLDKDRIIDAGPAGNLARFMNHSCTPNCITQKWMVNGSNRVGLFAINDIKEGKCCTLVALLSLTLFSLSGEELTFNYNLVCRGNEKTSCHCGSSECCKFIGVRPSKASASEKTPNGTNGTPKRRPGRPSKGGSSVAKTKKREKQKEFTQFHEDYCFVCDEGGELIMCDKKGCPKSYHLSCIKRESIPRGRWNCPYHHCDECGKASDQFCSQCPTSFCPGHHKNMAKTSDGLLLCDVHSGQEEKSDEIVDTCTADEVNDEKVPAETNGITGNGSVDHHKINGNENGKVEGGEVEENDQDDQEDKSEKEDEAKEEKRESNSQDKITNGDVVTIVNGKLDKIDVTDEVK